MTTYRKKPIPVEAEPDGNGDWIVTEPDGTRFIVPGPLFDESYEVYDDHRLAPKEVCPECGHDGEHHMSDPERALHDGCFHEVPDEETKTGHRRCGCAHLREPR